MTSDIVSNLRRSFVGKNDRKMKSGVKTIAWVDSDRRKVESPIKFPSPISTAVCVLASNKISVDQFDFFGPLGSSAMSFNDFTRKGSVLVSPGLILTEPSF